MKKVIAEYSHPCGLYAAIIETCEENPKVVAEYLSDKAKDDKKWR
jgi:hypothetical protein